MDLFCQVHHIETHRTIRVESPTAQAKIVLHAQEVAMHEYQPGNKSVKLLFEKQAMLGIRGRSICLVIASLAEYSCYPCSPLQAQHFEIHLGRQATLDNSHDRILCARSGLLMKHK